MIVDAGRIVAKSKKLVTGGTKAIEPNLGADYLKLGERIHEEKDQELYPVEEFIYRGSTYRETKKLIETYNIVTHPQHYCWYPELMLAAYKKYQPKWYEALVEMRETFNKPGEDAAIEAIYRTMDKGPTEEVTKHVFNDGLGQVILLPFTWTDVGTWGSVYEYCADEGISSTDCKVVTINSSGSLAMSSNREKLITLAGIDDLVVVDTDDVLLVIPKNKIEQIKDIQSLVEEKYNKKYL
jgi:mannose-1-phosphate guanylyltransferase